MTDSKSKLGPARVLVADPPWQFGDSGNKHGGTDKHYATLDVRDVMRFPLPPLADNAILFLWRVAAMQQEALDVIRAWGFTLKSEIVWLKTTGDSPDAKLVFGAGHYTRHCHETCLIATRGRFQVKSKSIRSVFDTIEFDAPRTEHSAKPDRFYDLVEELAGGEEGGPYAELFARRYRAGWMCFGNALDIRDPDHLRAEQRSGTIRIARFEENATKPVRGIVVGVLGASTEAVHVATPAEAAIGVSVPPEGAAPPRELSREETREIAQAASEMDGATATWARAEAVAAVAEAGDPAEIDLRRTIADQDRDRGDDVIITGDGEIIDNASGRETVILPDHEDDASADDPASKLARATEELGRSPWDLSSRSQEAAIRAANEEGILGDDEAERDNALDLVILRARAGWWKAMAFMGKFRDRGPRGERLALEAGEAHGRLCEVELVFKTNPYLIVPHARTEYIQAGVADGYLTEAEAEDATCWKILVHYAPAAWWRAVKDRDAGARARLRAEVPPAPLPAPLPPGDSPGRGEARANTDPPASGAQSAGAGEKETSGKGKKLSPAQLKALAGAKVGDTILIADRRISTALIRLGLIEAGANEGKYAVLPAAAPHLGLPPVAAPVTPAPAANGHRGAATADGWDKARKVADAVPFAALLAEGFLPDPDEDPAFHAELDRQTALRGIAAP